MTVTSIEGGLLLQEPDAYAFCMKRRLRVATDENLRKKNGKHLNLAGEL